MITKDMLEMANKLFNVLNDNDNYDITCFRAMGLDIDVVSRIEIDFRNSRNIQKWHCYLIYNDTISCWTYNWNRKGKEKKIKDLTYIIKKEGVIK